MGIAPWDHVIGFCRPQSVANGTFQLPESGMSAAGKILSESLLGLW